MGTLILVAVLAGVVIGVVRAIVNLNFGEGWMYALDAAWFAAWAGYSYSSGHSTVGGVLLFLTAVRALAARYVWKEKRS